MNFASGVMRMLSARQEITLNSYEGTFVPSKVPSVTFKREVFLFYARKNQAIF